MKGLISEPVSVEISLMDRENMSSIGWPPYTTNMTENRLVPVPCGTPDKTGAHSYSHRLKQLVMIYNKTGFYPCECHSTNAITKFMGGIGEGEDVKSLFGPREQDKCVKLSSFVQDFTQ